MVLEALIFDVDGTLAETEEAHRQSFNEVFADEGLGSLWPDPTHGWVWDQTTYARLLRTTGGKERIAAYLRDDLGIDPVPHAARIASIHAAKTSRFGELLAAGLAPRPGISELLAMAGARGLRLAIATTTSRPNVDAVCRACFDRDTEAIFTVVAAGDEVARKKPAPDVYTLALTRLGLPASACLAIEDSLNGLSAAHAAGLRCLVSPSLYTRHENLSAAEWLVPDLADPAISAAIGPAQGR